MNIFSRKTNELQKKNIKINDYLLDNPVKINLAKYEIQNMKLLNTKNFFKLNRQMFSENSEIRLKRSTIYLNINASFKYV